MTQRLRFQSDPSIPVPELDGMIVEIVGNCIEGSLNNFAGVVSVKFPNGFVTGVFTDELFVEVY